MSAAGDDGTADNGASKVRANTERRFAPGADVAANANVTAEAYGRARADRLGLWAERALRLTRATVPRQTPDWSEPPFAKWFADGELNVAYNCVDRHVEAGHGDRIALHFEGEPGDSRAISHAEPRDEVGRAADALTELGVGKGDRVAIHLPMIPEAVVSMPARARIGAPHSVVFGGLPVVFGGCSADALASRISDADAGVVITADGGYRCGEPSALKPAVDDAVARTSRGGARRGGAPHRPGRGLDRGPGHGAARDHRPAVRRAQPRAVTSPAPPPGRRSWPS